MTQPPSKRLVRESDLNDPNTPAGASLSATIASLATMRHRAPRQPFAPAPGASVSTDAPTVTYVDSTVGGANSTYLALPQVLPSDPRLTLLGCIQGARTWSGTWSMMNVSNGHYSASDLYPTATPTPYQVEFDYVGSVLRLAEVAATTGALPWQMWVDGKPIGASSQTTPTVASATTSRIWTLTWGTVAKRRLRFLFPANFALRSFAPGDTNYSFNPVPRPTFRAFIIGDSWTEGTGATASVTALPVLISRLTGWEVFSGGQGGSGYGAKPADGSTTGSTPFGSPQRIRALAEAAAQPGGLDLIVFAGTSNNDATASATLQGYVAQALADAATAAPGVPIIGVGPQNTANAPSASRLAARDAIKAAFDAAGRPFIDPLAEAWITGTGTVASPGTAGNASLFSGGSTGSDASHLNQTGYEFWAARVVERLLTELDAAN